LTRAVRQTEREDGWASVSQLGSYIGQNDASFDARSYGYAKLSDLIRAQDFLELREVGDANGFNQLWVGLKSQRKPVKTAAAGKTTSSKKTAQKASAQKTSTRKTSTQQRPSHER